MEIGCGGALSSTFGKSLPKMHPYIKVSVAVAVMFALGGCLSPGLPSEDSVEVKQIEARGRPGDPYIIVTATVAYTLASAKEARLSLGLDANSPGRISLVAEQPITQGQGTATLSSEIAVTPNRRILSAVLTIDQKNRGSGPPYASRRIAVRYPAPGNEAKQAPESTPAGGAAPAAQEQPRQP